MKEERFFELYAKAINNQDLSEREKVYAIDDVVSAYRLSLKKKSKEEISRKEGVFRLKDFRALVIKVEDDHTLSDKVIKYSLDHKTGAEHILKNGVIICEAHERGAVITVTENCGKSTILKKCLHKGIDQ